MPVIAHLCPGINLLPWFPIAGSEVAVVKYQGGQPCIRKGLGIVVEVHLFYSGEAMGHHNSRKWSVSGIREVQPATQGGPFCIEFDVLTHVENPFSLEIHFQLRNTL